MANLPPDSNFKPVSMFRRPGLWLQLGVMVLALILALGYGFWTASSLGVFTGGLAQAASAERQTEPAGLGALTRGWRDDRVWYDGLAEIAEYDAERMIYGRTRRYVARAMTNKERYNPAVTTKANGQGPEVFKHHWREDIPTANYVYHFSTMAYALADDLSFVKVEMGSQEDCGATFKQWTIPAPGSSAEGTVAYIQSSYFPDQGIVTGGFESPVGLVSHDALPLILRGYPFEERGELTFMVVPDATTTHLSAVEPVSATVRYGGLESVSWAGQETPSHRLTVSYAEDSGLPVETYWFEADPGRQHLMIQAETVHAKYTLKRIERRAYW